MKHLVCYSGGEGSALVAVMVQRRYGSDDLILLNHDISPNVEDPDVKRFKDEVARYLRVPISYANAEGWREKDQFDVCVEADAFKVGSGTALCTNRLKTAPFDAWLEQHYPTGEGVTIYYGFGADEMHRIDRRAQIMGARGYATDYPLATWPRTIQSIREIGIEPPLTYSTFRHANCVGCLKAGMQHWYVVYCTRPDIFAKAIWAEDQIGYTIIKDKPMRELGERFEAMRRAGVEPTEKTPSGQFWAKARRAVSLQTVTEDAIPCECST